MKTWIPIVVVSVLAASAGFFIYTKTASDTAPVAEQSEPIATTPVSDVRTLPDISLKNRAGEMQSLRSWEGKSLIVNFWATWCAPCRKEIPLLKQIAKTKEAAGFQVVGIAIDYREDVLKYADEINIDYPLLIGEQEGIAAANAFGIDNVGLPFTAFSDNQGRIVTLLMGELTEKKADVILAEVERVNRGELSPDAARAAIALKLQELKKA